MRIEFSGGSKSRAALRAAAKQRGTTSMSTGRERVRWRLLVLVVILLALGALLLVKRLWLQPMLANAQRETAQAADAKAIEQLLADQNDAWNRGDLEGFMAGYWHSPDMTFFSGNDIHQGWDAALQRYRDRYQGEGKEMGQLTFSDLHVELLGADSAVARGRWKV